MATIQDEMSSKMAQTMFEQVVRAIDFGSDIAVQLYAITGQNFKGTGKALKETGDKIKNIIGQKKYDELIEKGDKISLAQFEELKKYCEVNSQQIKIHDADADRFEGLLQNEKIVYACVDLKEDNCRMFVFLDTDLDKVNRAALLVNAEKGTVTEIPPDLFVQAQDTSSIREVAHMSAAEVELFRHFAQNKSNLFFTVIPGTQDDNTIIINTSQKGAAQAAQRTMTEVGWALTSSEGARIKEQLEYRIAGRTALLQSIDDAKKELYIVNKHDPTQFVHISNNEYSVYKNNNHLTTFTKLENNQEEFRESCLTACEGIPHAVFLTPEEFGSGVSVETLAGKPTMEVFPEGYNTIVEAAALNEMVNFVTRSLKEKEKEQEAVDRNNIRIKNAADKMEIDNEGNSQISPWDESVSYSEFAQYEFIADEEQYASRERQFNHFKDAAFYSKNNFEVEDYSGIDKDVDVLVEKAEQKRKDRAAAAERMRQNQTRDEYTVDEEEQAM